jgi:8-oxo-dGTP pyrophosphatase MutT (NUDIX family)
MSEKRMSGEWDDNVSWEFYTSAELPPVELCTAVFCLAFSGDRIVLTRTKRGWEMLGGHIEPGETVHEALYREAHEEGGFTPRQHRLFGYKKIRAKQPVPSRVAGQFYPFPIGYVTYFIATSDAPLVAPHGDDGEILESRAFTFEEVAKLGCSDYDVMEIGYAIQQAS